MDQKILNKGITITEISMKSVKSGSKYALKDHEGRTFNFFTTKQDGTDTQAHAQFKSMGLKVGSTVTIGYVEDSFTTQDGRAGITKKIISFRELNGEPSQTAPQTESARGEVKRGQSGNSSDAFGRRLALHGFVNGMLAAGATVDVIKNDLPALLALEDEIDNLLAGGLPQGKPFNSREFIEGAKRVQAALEHDELPVIQQDEPPLYDDELPPY